VRSQATPVVAPKPQIRTPLVQRIVASATPRQGSQPTQGASSVAGPGTGAGGAGNGTGSGAGGNGSGSGDGGIAEPPHLASPVLRGPDFPRDLLDQWPRGGTVFMRLRIDPNGNVAECMIDRGSGVATIDASLCNIVHDRLRFRPALNRSGQAVAGWFGYAQPAPR
jgi:protein TonB